MAKISPGLRKYRRQQKRGAIMRPATFARIKKRAAADPKVTDPEKVAGAAYWRAAMAKHRQSRRKGGSRK